MYYSQQCSYCNKVFYTYDNDKELAAQRLYAAIKQHLKEYDEDHKEYKYDDGETADTNEIYYEMNEATYPPSGGYKID